MCVRAILAVALVIGIASVTLGAQATSANYILDRSVIGSAGNAATSTNYKLGSTLGQSSPIGPSSSTNYKVGAGFWYEPVYPVGDVNHDCSVNVMDLISIRNRMNQDPGSSPAAYLCDVNMDGKINVMDLIAARNHMGEKCQF